MPYLKKISAVTLSTLLILAVVLSVSAEGRRLTKETFTVAPGSYKYFRFNASENGAKVSGKFRAEGGSGNDIEVFLLDEDGFENYRNGHDTKTYYNSGRVTVGRINVRLGEGEYYLVFNNGFSSFSNKVVTSDIFIE